MSNKERILTSALRLFNENGSSTISTNHIAENCAISPGNLYYHFRNKEEIIAALFEQMIAQWENQTSDSEPAMPTSAIVDAMLEKMFRFVWEYRFIHRELPSLLQQNDDLRKLCQKVLQRRIAEIEAFIQFLEMQRYLRALNNSERNMLAQTALMYGLFWQPYLEVTGQKSTKKQVQQSIDIVRQLLETYRIHIT